MSITENQLQSLRRVINENLRVQRGGAEPVPYIDVSNALSDICARQNHAVFARRGCGKTLLLHHSAKQLPQDIQPVYLNCEGGWDVVGYRDKGDFFLFGFLGRLLSSRSAPDLDRLY